ncbi:2-oxoglutarate and iron-dependent oxygenase domain-containing protein 2 isoform X2 [Xenopus tropicalis]|uniref:2-oxoglutarate and iron-dependent oxygenase domain-containing protein 2 isoform X2 n=3 Tax=Xenopus tropicalis TaxID=8364 RepID=A0A8J0SPF4_XENTR|nr:2-oxoglutarate and iron-dependent oxygenase domain-containing protein 2 isoform X2 [Xenopus tropicalis]|eukprot:XP_012819960.1 PREDICTED: 2-oxoglutarate and iron-dependent oxygenase domain-containing protein 2 isoform X2 [Xenopus tropicalis]
MTAFVRRAVQSGVQDFRAVQKCPGNMDMHTHVKKQEKDNSLVLTEKSPRPLQFSANRSTSPGYQESFLAAEFLTAVKYSKSPQANVEGLLHHLHSITDKRIYRLPVFIPEFCAKLVEELENFERSDLPKGRPNTMNNYGILLNELGFVDALTAPLCEKYIEPLTSLLFPDWGGGCLDSHRAFVVKYALQEDLDLSCHYDNAEVTLNVSLGKEFTDGNLYFSDMKEVPVNERTYAEVEHITGQGILHRGQHVHGALPISSGERWNLILWMRASDVRNKCCPMCDNEPVLVKTLGDGDGFTSVREDREQTVDICTLT